MYANLNSKQRDVLIQCLLKANHEPKKWEWQEEIIELKEGQFKTSLNSLQEDCAHDVSIRNIRTAIKKLEKWGFLTNKSTKTGRIITVCNWESYQKNGKTTDKETDKQLTKNRQRTDKEVTTNKNVKNDKNEKKYLVAEFVKLKKSEYKKLRNKYGKTNTIRMVKKLNNYKGAHGKKYKSDYRAILNWVVDEVVNKKPKREDSIWD